MDWLWTHGGRALGYREEDDLWTYSGLHVGHFVGEEVYDKEGKYLGEILNGRLITCVAKAGRREARFTAKSKRAGYVKHVDYVGYAMLVGYVDFPELEKI